jgi:hypothetical protein
VPNKIEAMNKLWGEDGVNFIKPKRWILEGMRSYMLAYTQIGNIVPN